MKPHHSVLAALILISWLFASAHVALEHGGSQWVCHGVAPHAHGPDGHDSAPEQEHHHHDLGAALAGKAITAPPPNPLPLWTTPGEIHPVSLTPFLRPVLLPHAAGTCEHSPPDQRHRGWLLVAHTALPVRGPSLAA